MENRGLNKPKKKGFLSKIASKVKTNIKNDIAHGREKRRIYKEEYRKSELSSVRERAKKDAKTAYSRPKSSGLGGFIGNISADPFGASYVTHKITQVHRKKRKKRKSAPRRVVYVYR